MDKSAPFTGSDYRYYRPVAYGAMADTPKQARSLWPLPGGAGQYLASLGTILHMVAETTDTDAVLDQIVATFERAQSRKTARSYLHVVADLGFVILDGPVVRLTTSGRKYLQTGDTALVREALLERVDGTAELLRLIEQQPRRIGLLHERMQESGYSWSTLSQVRYRLRWLEEVGAVTRHGTARPEYRLRTAR
jgi:hypothetical protein